jgi:starch-binding outer membrane protein, SusD/RagB family
MADNVYQHPQNSNRYTLYNQYQIAVNDGNASGMWTQFYNVILRTNNVINSSLTGTPAISQIKGEAKAVRALCYFYLIRFYASPFTESPSGLGVPIIKTFDVSLKPTRNTITEVYDFIQKDLTEAFAEMTTFTNSSLMHKWAARALEAKVRLTRGDMAGALAAAQDVISNSTFTSLTPTNHAAFWAGATFRTDRLEVLFEVSMDAVGNLGFDALTNIYNQLGYGDMMISDDVFAKYSATDVRRALYQPSMVGQPRHPTTFVRKYLNLATERDETKLLRMSDVYLIAAEASAATNATQAQNFLNFVATRRDPSFTGFTSTGAQLVNDIIEERQKELMCEGDRFHDLNRLKRAITRSTNFPSAARSISYPFNRRLLPIPQSETDANPNIATQQNPGY